MARRGLLLATMLAAICHARPAGAGIPATSPVFGPHVFVISPAMPQSRIQAIVDGVAATQLSNQFGPQRFAILFEPGTYGSTASPLNFQVGYYTSVAGLGASPGDVVINGSINVYNQCTTTGSGTSCVALNNFWRSLSNLTINVSNAIHCTSSEFWAVSQAAPMRRVQVNGQVTLMDYCSGPSYASGGFIADSDFEGSNIINGSQQQWLTRNSIIDSWTNGVWNQVFSGDVGAPAGCFPAQASCGGNPYTTLATSPVTREAPFAYVDGSGGYNVFVPSAQTSTSGTSWANGGSTPGRSIPLSDFYVASPGDAAATINAALASGKHLLLTPGVYMLDQAIKIADPDTVVLGLGFPTLVPLTGQPAMVVSSNKGVVLSGLLFDAGPVVSPVLLRIGCAVEACGAAAPADPSLLSDVFFRIGGATAGSATKSLVVDSDDAILDDIWAWRADHGNGVGWNRNRADTGLVVNGDNVTAYGLFVEHFQKTEIVWSGDNGTDIFLQNEMPYDPPSQAQWKLKPGVYGYPAMKIASGVTRFKGYGLGSYSNFTAAAVYASDAFQVPSKLPAGSLNNLLTVFLNSSSFGGILNVVNYEGGISDLSNADAPVTVVSYP
jgi:hypothetical protein